MNNKKPSLEDIVSLCKRRGFIYQGSEIYGGLAGTWDYGPLGVQLKRNITNLWWKTFVEDREDMYGVDASILMNQKVWQASGHTETFADPMIVCKECGQAYREDHLDYAKPCIKCGSKDSYGAARPFNMMFKTNVGPIENESSISYLRPETAQGIFTNYKNIVDNFYPDIPFGIAQIGKAFRNEISPRDFVFRSREFEQMEIEFFVHPDNWQEWFERWLELIRGFLAMLSIPSRSYHEVEVEEKERAHYSKRTVDFDFDYPHKSDELLGLAYRTDFDLTNIQKATGKSMEYRPKDNSRPFVPHVIEPSFGVERLIMAVLTSAYAEDEVGGEKRVFLRLPENIAPVKIAVFPLLKNKPELIEKAREVYKMLKKNVAVMPGLQSLGEVAWDDNGNIGKRYRRQDEIGTPKCVTIDFDTLQDGTVTVRDRDTTKQTRVKIDELIASLE